MQISVTYEVVIAHQKSDQIQAYMRRMDEWMGLLMVLSWIEDECTRYNNEWLDLLMVYYELRMNERYIAHTMNEWVGLLMMLLWIENEFTLYNSDLE